MAFPIEQDPDFSEAITQARLCEDGDRTDLFEFMIGDIVARRQDIETARALIEELPIRRRARSYLRVALWSLDPKDMLAALEAWDVQLSESLDQSMGLVYAALRACHASDWIDAREKAARIDDDFDRAQILRAIATLSRDPNDEETFKRFLQSIDRDTPMYTIGLASVLGMRTPEARLQERLNVLNRLIDNKAFDFMVSAQVCLVAAAGGVERALEVADKYRLLEKTNEKLQYSFAVGYALNGDIDTARAYLAKVTRPYYRAQASMRIYLAKFSNTSTFS